MIRLCMMWKDGGTSLLFSPVSEYSLRALELPSARERSPGAGEVIKTAFSIPVSSLDYWQQRLRDHGISAERKGKRFDEEVLAFPDPDGMKIEIVADANSASVNAPRSASVPPEHAIRFSVSNPIDGRIWLAHLAKVFA